MSGSGWATLMAGLGGLAVFTGSSRSAGALRWFGIALLGAASLRLMVWESSPGLFGNALAPVWLRGLAFVLAIGGWYAAAWTEALNGRRYWAWLLAANLLTVWWLTLEITIFYPNNHAIPYAHEGLVTASAWSLYGLGLAVADQRLRHRYVRIAALVMVAAGLIFLMVGVLPSQARWALPGYRYFAYSAVLGSAWAVEAMFARTHDDHQLHGLLGLTALACGFIITDFEVARWLEPVFTFPQHTFRSQASWDWEAAIRANWLMIAWGLYALAAMAGAVIARSARGRLLAGGLAIVALAAGAYGAFQSPAPLTLRLPALAAAAGGAAVSAWLAGRTEGPQLRYESIVRRALWFGSAGVVLVHLGSWLLL